MGLARCAVAPAVPQRRGGPRAAMGLARCAVATAVPQRRGGPRAAMGLDIEGEIPEGLLQPAQYRQGDVDYRDTTAGRPAQRPAMGVAVDGEVGPELIERAGKAGGAEEGKDLQRLAFERLPARRIM